MLRLDYFERTRTTHWAGVLAVGAYGFFALLDVKLITSAGDLLALALSCYALVFIGARSFLLRDSTPADRRVACFDLLEMAVLLLALSFIGGFWWGFAGEVLDGGFKVKHMYERWMTLFGLASSGSLAFALTASAVTFATTPLNKGASATQAQRQTHDAPEDGSITPSPSEIGTPLTALRASHQELLKGEIEMAEFRSVKQRILTALEWGKLGDSPEDALLELMKLRDEGVIDDNDIKGLKAKILA